MKSQPLEGLPAADGSPAAISQAAVHCREWLGGLFKHYHRAA